MHQKKDESPVHVKFVASLLLASIRPSLLTIMGVCVKYAGTPPCSKCSSFVSVWFMVIGWEGMGGFDIFFQIYLEHLPSKITTKTI